MTACVRVSSGGCGPRIRRTTEEAAGLEAKRLAREMIRSVIRTLSALFNFAETPGRRWATLDPCDGTESPACATLSPRSRTAGAPTRALQEWMGHKHVSATERYADYAPRATEGEMISAAFTVAGAETRIRAVSLLPLGHCA